MRFYAERPARAALQLLVDLLVVGWITLCVLIARTAHDLVLRLQEPARALAGAGESIRGAFDDAARTASGMPFVGDDMARALGTGSGAGNSLAGAGQEQVEVLATVATGTAFTIVLLGALPALLVWLPRRLRYARLAGSAVTARSVDTDLLALRAIAHRPVRELLDVAPDPAAAWRRDDRDVVRELAALELRSLGLREPRHPPG
jgi:hypothetical protein